MSESRFEIFNDVARERFRQDDIWGPQSNHPLSLWMTILMEEVGEVAHDILEDKLEEAKKELVQVAAVAVSIIEHIEEGTYEQ